MYYFNFKSLRVRLFLFLFQAHRQIHTGNKPVFQCQLCPTTCGRKTDLRIHMQKLHNIEKTSTLRCRKCSKNFDDRYNYKLHMKTHEGEKTYSCGKIWLFQKPRHLLFSTQLYLHFALVIL